MSQAPYRSHIDSCFTRFYGRFKLMPFQFFGEKEIHYEFCNELNELRGKKPNRYGDMRIIREYPTSCLYKKDENNLLIDDPGGKKAYIDVVIKHPSGNIGHDPLIS